MTQENKTKEWFSCRYAFTYNTMLNFILSERGIGKTYNTSSETFKICLRELKTAIDTNRIIIWVRRGVNELDDMRGQFSKDIAHLFPEYEFKDQGEHVYVRPITDEDDEKNEWHLLLVMYSVKWFKKAKGNKISKFVKFIVFDEFIPEDGKYFGGAKEPEYFMNLCDSFIRSKDDCKIILLANSIQLFNPYFDFFDIMPNLVSEFTNFKNKDTLIQLCPVGKYRSAESNDGISRMKNLVKNTSYAQTAMSNNFRDNSSDMVELKTQNAIPLGVIQIDGMDISVWYDSQFEKIWYSNKRVSKLLPRFSFDETSETYESFRNMNDSILFDRMISARQNNTYRFESAKVKSAVTNKLKGTIFL